MFSVEIDGVKSLSVLEGYDVILHTRITNIPRDDVIEWTFGPQKTSVVKTDRKNEILLYNEDDVKFTGKLHLNIQTGDLTISNINTEVSGLYQLKIIKSTYTIEKSFSVTVGGECFKSFEQDLIYLFPVNNLGCKTVKQLKQCLRSHTFTLMTISLFIITETRVSGAASGICGAAVGLVVWAVTAFLLQEV